MDTSALLMEGFATALTPINLLYAVIGVLLGTAVGVLPGIGPAMTVALLLPVTYDLEPTSAFIMFAGIYYGGMYGGSTTSILLNTPGESAVGRHRDRGQQDGQGRQGPPGPGHRRDRLVRRRHDRHRSCSSLRRRSCKVAVEHRRAGLLRDHGARVRRRDRRARRARGCAGSPRCDRADDRAGRHRLDHRAAAADLRHAAPGRRHRRRRRRGRDLRGRRGVVGRRAPAPHARGDHPGRAGVDGQARTGSAPGSRGCAARRSGSRSARCPRAARRSRPSCPTSPRSGSPSTRRSSARARSRAWPGRRPPNNASAAGTLVPMLALGLPTSATAAVMLAAFQLRHPARAAAVRHASPSWCGA